MFDSTEAIRLCARLGYSTREPGERVALALSSVQGSPIYGTRIQPGAGIDIEWFIYCGEHSDDDDFYQAVHLHHLPAVLPEVLPYLLLPPGSHFIIDRSGYEDVWTDQERGGPLA